MQEALRTSGELSKEKTCGTGSRTSLVCEGKRDAPRTGKWFEK